MQRTTTNTGLRFWLRGSRHSCEKATLVVSASCKSGYPVRLILSIPLLTIFLSVLFLWSCQAFPGPSLPSVLLLITRLRYENSEYRGEYRLELSQQSRPDYHLGCLTAIVELQRMR